MPLLLLLLLMLMLMLMLTLLLLLLMMVMMLMLLLLMMMMMVVMVTVALVRITSARCHGNQGWCLARASLHVQRSSFFLLFLEIDFLLFNVLIIVVPGDQGRGLLSVDCLALLLDLLGEGGRGFVDDSLHLLGACRVNGTGQGGVAER
jgi:hypothetical protein